MNRSHIPGGQDRAGDRGHHRDRQGHRERLAAIPGQLPALSHAQDGPQILERAHIEDVRCAS